MSDILREMPSIITWVTLDKVVSFDTNGGRPEDRIDHQQNENRAKRKNISHGVGRHRAICTHTKYKVPGMELQRGSIEVRWRRADRL